MSEPACCSYRGTVWSWYEEFASDVCCHKLAVDYLSRERGFRLVEEVEDPKTTLSEPGSLRAVRGGEPRASRRGASGTNIGGARVGYRSRNLGLRLVEEVIDE